MNIFRRLDRLVETYSIQDRSSRDGGPFCFNVKMHCSMNFDKAFAEMVKANYINKADALLSIPDVALLRSVFEADNNIDWNLTPAWTQNWREQCYDSVIEDMQRSFTDTDTFRCVRPALEKKWKVDSSKCWNVKYAFVGRSGGWLAMTEFEGHNAVMMDRPAISEYMKEETARKLCAMLEEVALSVAKREEEFHYQCGFQLFQLVEDQCR